jgi:hypothetical protein
LVVEEEEDFLALGTSVWVVEGLVVTELLLIFLLVQLAILLPSEGEQPHRITPLREVIQSSLQSLLLAAVAVVNQMLLVVVEAQAAVVAVWDMAVRHI